MRGHCNRKELHYAASGTRECGNGKEVGCVAMGVLESFVATGAKTLQRKEVDCNKV